MKDDEKNALIEHRIARATDTIEEASLGEEMAGYAGQSNKKTFYRIAETQRGIQRQ